jgi:hypothetical protein
MVIPMSPLSLAILLVSLALTLGVVAISYLFPPNRFPD